MREYLAVSYDTDSVVGSGPNLETLVREVVGLGYKKGYVTNQDGGRASIPDLIERFEIEDDTDEV